MSYPDDVFISWPIEKITDQIVEIYDPVTKKTGERILLNHERNRTMLFFYPADFSFVCPTELEKLNSLYHKFHMEGAEILVVSRDSALVHKKWVEMEPRLQGFKIKMISDKDGVIGRDIGIINKLSKEYERCTMIVAPDGRLAHLCVVSNKLGRNIEELLRRIQALNKVLRHPEVMCPEHRQDGDAGIEVCPLEEEKVFVHGE